MQTIDTLKLSPYLRFARRLELVEGYDFNDIIARDARLLYVTAGDGAIIIDGGEYKLTPGTLLCWQAGSRYKFTGLCETALELVMLNLDFAGDDPYPGRIMPVKPGHLTDEMLEGNVRFTENTDDRGVIIDHSCFWVEPILDELLAEYSEQRIYSQTVTRGLLTSLLARLSRSARISPSGEPDRSDEIIAYIRAHLHERLTYDTLSKIFNYHPNHLSRIITRGTGLPLHKYLTKLRLERAFVLLTDGKLTIAEIAVQCGFADTSSFSKRFRLETGLTPTEVGREKR